MAHARTHFKQLWQFALVGLTGTGIQYLCIAIADYFSWGVFHFAPSVTGSAVGYLLGSISNYFLNYFYTFKSDGAHSQTAGKYFTLLAAGWCINLGMMTLFVQYLQWWHWPAQILTTGVVFTWNFLGSKWWAFKH